MAACFTPFTKKETDEQFPCGKCPNCLKRRVSGWSFRLKQTEMKAISSMFITLTYDTKHVPISHNGFMSLKLRDLQLFFKRLRKEHAKTSSDAIRYYAVGEYGGKFNRPHYHVILFNAQIAHIQNAWSLGATHYGDVTGASIGYTLKYMTKPPRIPMHRNDDRVREFSVMSKGLGKEYLTKAKIEWHKADPANRMIIPIEDGKKIAMPRYFKQKIFSDQEREEIAATLAPKFRDQLMKEIDKVGVDKYWHNRKQQHMADIRKMHKNSLQGRDKIDNGN